MFKIYHQNAQNATNKLNDLELIVKEISPDIIIISEHGFSQQISQYFKIPNYTQENIFCRSISKWGGVAIFSKEHYRCKPFPLNLSLEKDFEISSTSIKTRQFNKLIIVGFYRSPSGNVNTFLEKMEILLTSLFSTRCNFIIVGDFNINVLNTENNTVKLLKNLLNSFNLIWQINSPTRVTPYTSTAIDNVITNINTYNFNVEIVDMAISDHFGQIVTLNTSNVTLDPPKIDKKRNVCFRNVQRLKQLLQNETWDFVYQSYDANMSFDLFYNKFISYLDRTCPYKNVRTTNFSKNSNWITKGILVSRKKLKHLNKLRIQTQNENFNIYYKNYKKIYRKVIKAAKSLEINRKIKTSKNISKTSWQIINNNKLDNRNTLTELNIDGIKIKDPTKIANTINKYFSNVAKNNNQSTFPIRSNYIENSMYLHCVSNEEVIKIIKELPPKKSTDIDGLSTWFFQMCYTEILNPITFLINISLRDGLFPQALKRAKILPIFKKGCSTSMGNYRPISLLPILSKVYEKVFLSRLLSFLNKYNIISNNQFGFCKGRNTVSAINKLLEFIISNIDIKNKTVSVFLDLSKAFDCVKHNKLISILNDIGIRGPPLNWVKSYLSNRTQQVEINNILSEIIQIEYGVPQGSILGPVLFIIYVNQCHSIECTNNLGICNVIQYADDTTLSFSANNFDNLNIIAQDKIKNCIKYFQDLNLNTNYIKSHFISFGNSIDNRICLNIENHSINEAKSLKFLGLYIDKKLCWDDHIDFVCKKISSGIFLLRNLSFYCNRDVLKLAYYGLIHPHILYGIVFWGNCAEAKVKRILFLQKSAIRIIFGLKYRESCRDAFASLNILTVTSLFILETLMLCFPKFKLTQQSNHSYDTRCKRVINFESHRLELFNKLPIHAGKKLFNKLPEYLKSIEESNKFKKSLKSYLLSKTLYSVGEFMES